MPSRGETLRQFQDKPVGLHFPSCIGAVGGGVAEAVS